jgi:alpha-N-arabinofuranosidase
MGFQAHAIHYYTSSGQKKSRYSATDFDEGSWFDVIQATLKMEDIIKHNIAIMDRYDPEKNVDLIIDEWGAWYDVEPGTNPRFLYQQNSLRDAIVTGLNLNIFNNYCERVFMANIAQTVNVLQAMVLTQDDKMVRTPTFYVYKLYVPHQDATMLPTQVKCDDYTFGEDKIPALNASASMDGEGRVHISIVNTDPNKLKEIECAVYGKAISKLQGQIITAAKINAYNDFDKTELVKIEEFDGMQAKNGKIHLDMPAKSIVMLEVE